MTAVAIVYSTVTVPMTAVAIVYPTVTVPMTAVTTETPGWKLIMVSL